MSEDYTADYIAFRKKLDEAEVMVKEIERAGIELPSLIVDKLCRGVLYYIDAREDHEKGGTENVVPEELQKALKYVRRATFDMLEFRFLFYSKLASSVINKNKMLASRYVINYDEQSKNFSEITKLIDDAKSPDEDSPESQATCEDVIKKLRTFLSNFKTGKGELFPTKNADPKIDLSGIPIDYDILSTEFFKKLDMPECMVKTSKEYGEKFPVSVAKEIYHGIVCYIRAKELFQANKKMAVTEMRKAVYHSRWAYFDTMKYFLLFCLRYARDDIHAEFGRYKDVALSYPKYSKHFSNLRSTRKSIEIRNWPDEDPLEDKDVCNNAQKLWELVRDFGEDEGKLIEAVKGKETPLQKKIRFGASVISSSSGEFIGVLAKRFITS